MKHGFLDGVLKLCAQRSERATWAEARGHWTRTHDMTPVSLTVSRKTPPVGDTRHIFVRVVAVTAAFVAVRLVAFRFRSANSGAVGRFNPL